MPTRVVSLVPSLTESLFDLGFGNIVVGITDYCIHPADKLANLPRLGGPKTPDLAAILKLHPDLIFVNIEENSPEIINAITAERIEVFNSFPQSARQCIDMLRVMVNVFGNPSLALGKIEILETSLRWVERAAEDRLYSQSPGKTESGWRYFCPIWQGESPLGKRWWMTFNQHTYSHDLLRLCGGINVFAQRQRLYPLEADVGESQVEPTGERDTRYPRVTLNHVLDAQPDIILLPSEPFPYDEKDKAELVGLFANTPAVRNGRVVLLDGSLITWYGTRLARALQELPDLFAECNK